jgi:rod shape-determining protein MreB
MDYVRRNHSLVIGDQTAEAVKIKIGSATKLAREESMNVKGRDTISGLPRTIILTSGDVNTALQKPLSQIVGVVKAVLEETPPELSSDIIDRGIVMSGGTSTLRNLDALLTREVGVPAYVAEEPLLCVVKGTGRAMENIDMYRRALK